MASTDDYGPRLNVTIWILTGVAAIFLGLRIYCKVWRGRPIRWDDCVLVLSWFALATDCSLLSVCTTLGYGKHNNQIPPENFDYVLLLSYVAGFFSILAACWSKISFAITLLRVTTSAHIKRFLWFVIISVNLVLGASATIHFVQCWPVERLWRPESPGRCWPRPVVIGYNVFAAAYSGCVDIVLALLPWLVVWAETISKKEKLSVLVAMSMGVFAGTTSFLKIPSTAAIGSKDMVDSVNLLIYGTAESAITIIAVSIPILRALLYRRTMKPRAPRFYHQTTSQEDSNPGDQPELQSPAVDVQPRLTLYGMPATQYQFYDPDKGQRNGMGLVATNFPPP